MTIRYVLFMPAKYTSVILWLMEPTFGCAQGHIVRYSRKTASDCHIFIYDVRCNRACALIENDFV